MRELFLALLSDERAHGYELKQSLEQEFGDLLPVLNAGQIYSTLSRLERDGLIVGQAVPGDSRGKRVYELTDAGRPRCGLDRAAGLGQATQGRVLHEVRRRASLVGEAKHLLEGQRREYLQSLRDLNALLEAEGKRPRLSFSSRGRSCI